MPPFTPAGFNELKAGINYWLDNSNPKPAGYTSDIRYLFSQKSTFNGDISRWDVSKVTNFHGCFEGATSFNRNLNNWKINTSEPVNMTNMFRYASSFNGKISNWDTSQVTSMAVMFQGAVAFNQNIGNWDVSNVTSMGGMFRL